MTATLDASGLTARDYQTSLKPIWCPGCGDYSVLSSTTKALAEMGVKREDIAVVTGIGCSGRFGSYTATYGFHGVHGRALAAGTGLKLGRPDLTVLVVGGDGDGFAIGGNHFLHAGRRNVDLTYIVMDNQVYGQTKGQASPTTLPDWEGSKLTPHGPGATPFQPLPVALAGGTNFIARGFSGDPKGLAALILEGILHPGFSFIDILSPCITFHPEQKEWKNMARKGAWEATDDPIEAGRRLLDDDGFNIGILYKGNREPFTGVLSDDGEISAFRQEFVV
jgi:2-oxoglutarate/2-oxoacid ferredoxin oxidoreductase subunit beta